MAERLKFVTVCDTCAGDGSVVDEDGDCLWVCPNCNGTGEEPGKEEYGRRV